mgnify:CR=1 FL=1
MREATLKEHLDNIIQDMEDDVQFFSTSSQDWQDLNHLKEWRQRWLDATIQRPGFCVGCHSCETPCKGATDV